MTIPNSVTSIGNSAFLSCTGLTSVTIPNSVTSIGDSAFDECKSLLNLAIMDGESTLYLDAYIGVYNSIYYVSFRDSPLEELYLGRNLSFNTTITQGIDTSPFQYNTGFKTISIGKYVKDASYISPSKYENLEEINCYGDNPPKIGSFTNVQYANVIVNIPEGCLDNYKKNSNWGVFWNLLETLPNPNSIIKPEQVIINAESADLTIGAQLQLEVAVLPDNTTDKTITWSTSNENVATVVETGLVTAVGIGEAIITASCGDVSAKCKVIVKAPGIYPEQIILNKDYIKLTFMPMTPFN